MIVSKVRLENYITEFYFMIIYNKELYGYLQTFIN
jgi:hypothetical protein